MSLRIIAAIALSVGVVFSGHTADFSGPLIDLPRVKSPGSMDATVKISAIVDDNTGIDSVNINFRIVSGDVAYKSLPMNPSTVNPKIYSIEIDQTIHRGNTIEYYVEARDYANNISQEPFPNKPRKIEFTKAAPASKTFHRSYFTRGELQYGGGVAFGTFSVEDPDGSTGSAEIASYSAVLTYGISHAWRGWAELSYQDFVLPYSNTEIGQDVSAIRLELLAQRSLSFNETLSWIGVGIGVDKLKITDRSYADNGIITQSFDDRSDINFGIVADAGMELNVLKDKSLDLHAKVFVSFGEGLTGATIGFVFLM